MKNFIKTNWGTVVAIAVVLLIPLLLLSVFWLFPKKSVLGTFTDRIHDVYCVEGTAYLVFNVAVVIAPPQSKHHAECVSPAAKGDTK